MKPKTKPATEKKTFKLSCLERLMILGLLAGYREGNFITFKTLSELRSQIGFTSSEISEFDLKEENGTTTWNRVGMEPKEFYLTDMEVKLVRDKLIELDKDSKLTANHLSTYELFM